MKGRTALWLAAALAAALLLCALGSGGVQSGAATQEERRIAEVLGAIEGAGRVEVALFFGEGTQTFGASSGPTGAVVVAEGAGDMAVRLRLIRAARTLLGLPEAAVDVFVMEEGR